MSLLDKFNQLVDFSTGTWRADLIIIEYPGDVGEPFATLSTESAAGVLQWLTLQDSSLVLAPDPAVTSEWNFYKYHYDLFLQGPNVNSKAELVDHGPFRLDK